MSTHGVTAARWVSQTKHPVTTKKKAAAKKAPAKRTAAKKVAPARREKSA